MEERFHTFTLLVASIVRSMRRIKGGEMSGFNLKSRHVSCLYYIYKSDSLTATELCELCDEDKANVSRSVRYLEENGFLLCESKRTKRYLAPMRLTDKGRDVAQRITQRIETVLAHSRDGISEEDLTVFYRSLAKISDNLQKFSEQYD